MQDRRIFQLIGDETRLKTGERVSIGQNAVLFLNDTIEIGNDTMIAINVVIHTSTHDYRNHPMWLEMVDRPVKIGSHVWIGLGAIILPGTIIEDFAVVGAGSVVNGIVPKGAIVAGNPARIIKYRDMDSCVTDEERPYPGVIKKGSYYDTYLKSK